MSRLGMKLDSRKKRVIIGADEAVWLRLCKSLVSFAN